jgi:hypothetical protein
LASKEVVLVLLVMMSLKVQTLLEKFFNSIMSLKYLPSLFQIYIFMELLSKGTLRYREIIFLTTSALFGLTPCPLMGFTSYRLYIPCSVEASASTPMNTEKKLESLSIL